MPLIDRLVSRWPAHVPVRPIVPQPWPAQEPTWRQARPAVIAAATRRAAARPSGNWFVLAASGDVRADVPLGAYVGPHEVVAWRDEDGGVVAGPGACPHLGAPLALGRVDGGVLRCRWHGLPVSGDGGPGWRPFPVHDDGVLVWVRLDGLGGEAPSPAPVVPARPTRGVAAVASVTGVCEPIDVVANRLDPWHGGWFHPYSFTRLRVVSAPEEDSSPERDRFVVDVTFRLGRRLGVPVRTEFTCPEPRTVCMRIIEGEGVGSVVETHATPRAPGRDGRARTSVIEAVIATSEREGFTAAMRAAVVLRPAMRWAAKRLWRDDMAYAERRYALRTGGC
ncbi:Rieske (2Fe-2S) protein [Actinokineospora sp. UTMC 2448]|uniref:Rieske (2Fe-2S) protein n=1 Tax=Actinokineospora sp. UTMC 2448 TaxID=2268449 RepID=UPI0021648EDD|nr:Rieske (2Fe-2S) protein [Actinokineospora sp. UTMC 2448]UVS78474.1 Toluene-4-sulfonate monooxygenase system iron-sulfur subunit TsaM1 [Actinokineospora sp. UTMC 2448]